jgi:opacity protein-like surface antigen
MNLFKGILTFITLLALPLSANAEETKTKENWYVGATSSLITSGSDDFTTDAFTNGSVSVGYRLNSLSAEIEGNYQKANTSFSYYREERLNIMLNGYYHFENTSSVTPYVGLGLGLGSTGNVINKGFKNQSLASQIMLGASHSISNSVDLSLEYRRVYSGMYIIENGKKHSTHTNNLVLGLNYNF